MAVLTLPGPAVPLAMATAVYAWEFPAERGPNDSRPRGYPASPTGDGFAATAGLAIAATLLVAAGFWRISGIYGCFGARHDPGRSFPGLTAL